MTSPRTPVDVAAGVLIRPDGKFLLASRPAGKPYASYWEFPGGKVEPGESLAAALTRELHEELGIDIGTPYPWVVRVFDYPHALVRLHFFRVFDWRGELRAREHQNFGFFSIGDLPDGPLLPATLPVLRWLALAPIYAISAAVQLGGETFLRRLDGALSRGLKLLQFREPGLDDADAEALFDQVRVLTRAAGATLLVVLGPASLATWLDGVPRVRTAFDLTRRVFYLRCEHAGYHSVIRMQQGRILGLDGLIRKWLERPLHCVLSLEIL